MNKYAVYASGKCTRIRKILEFYPDYVEKICFIIVDEKEDRELKDYFKSLKIDYYSFDFKAYDINNDRNLLFSNYLLENLNKYEVDYCFSFGSHILKGDILTDFKHKLINFHPGIIPEVIGLRAIDKALSEKKQYIGNTVHFIDEGVDSGPIIMQNLMLADNFKKYGYDLFLDGQIELFVKTVKLLEENRIEVKNNKVVIKNADYTVSHIFPRFET